MGAFDQVWTIEQVEAARVGKPIAKGPTRLEVIAKQLPIAKGAEAAFRHEVWTRDRYRCRCCRRKVSKTLSRVPWRGEVNHLHGRVGELRYEVRAALLLCLTCHEHVTGRVNARWHLVATETFTTAQGTFTDATFLVRKPVA